MSLTSALSIGRSGLAANQAALEVAGNNLANASNPGYTRQSAVLAANGGVEVQQGIFIGTGVKLQQIARNVDTALESRLRAAIGDEQAAIAKHDLLSQLEAITNDLSDTGLSSRLNQFFDAFSELANNPTETSLQTLVVREGASLSGYVQGLRGDLVQARNQLDDQIRAQVKQADSLLDQIAGLNSEVAFAEGGAGGANALRDERDQLINELSKLLDVSTVEQSTGATDVFLNGVPLVLAGQSRGIKTQFATATGGSTLEIELRLKDDGTFLSADSGTIGSLIDIRAADMVPAIETLDQFAGALIEQVNRIHSGGQGSALHESLIGEVQVDDPAAALTHADAGLAFVPEHGSFQLHVTQKSTGTRTTRQIDVDLDGIGGADMSLNDLSAAIDAVANVSSAVTVDGRLQITGDSADFEFSFSDDSSGALAALGVNTFFAGSDATDIATTGLVNDDPSFVAARTDHTPGGNDAALAIADLRERGLADLGGLSLTQLWAQHIEDYAVRTSEADQNVSSSGTVVESLTAQREAVSGVSVDEEAINLLAYQRAYQGSARFLSVVDELMETLIGMV